MLVEVTQRLVTLKAVRASEIFSMYFLMKIQCPLCVESLVRRAQVTFESSNAEVRLNMIVKISSVTSCVSTEFATMQSILVDTFVFF